MEMMELKEIDTARAMLRQTQVVHFIDRRWIKMESTLSGVSDNEARGP